jgi:hypothetical protein
MRKIPVRIVIPVVIKNRFFRPKLWWSIWAKTIGNKISDDNQISDSAAVIRTLWIAIQLLTCIAIIANCIRHWNG